jgi:hypothetical protein
MTVSLAMTASLVIAVGVGLDTACPAAAQDASEARATDSSTAHSDGTSDRERRRHDRRQAEASAKAEHASKKEASASAASEGNGQPQLGAQAAPDAPPANIVYVEPELVCKSVRVTGTRMPKRVCAPAEVWDDVNERGEEGARQFRQQMNDAIRVPPDDPARVGPAALQ